MIYRIVNTDNFGRDYPDEKFVGGEYATAAEAQAEANKLNGPDSGMLNQLLHLDKPLFVLDLETTSLDVKEARIIEIAFQRWESIGLTKEWSSRINPGIQIPASSSKVHGIFDADVADKPTFKQLAVNLAKGLSDCSFANQNIRFDLRILSAEFARAGVEWSYTCAKIIDSFVLERLAVPRSLSHLHEKYTGAKHDGAHGALSDVRAAATVIAKQLEAHDALPRDLAKLHELSWPGEIDEGGKFRIIDNVAVCQFGKWRGKPMRDIPIDYYDWLLKSDFPADVKRLAADAKLGKFPA